MGEEERKEGLRISRREFLAAAGAGVVGIAAGFIAGVAVAPGKERVVEKPVTKVETQVQTVTETTTETQVKEVPVRLAYKREKIANVRDLAEGKPLTTTYMGKPIIVLKLG